MRFTPVIILAVILASLTFARGEDAVVVVVHVSNPVHSLSAHDLRQIFLGKKVSWPDGRTIIPVVQKSGVAHTCFLRTYIKKTDRQFAMYWKKALFTGTGFPPETVQEDANVTAFIADHPQAIGYLSQTTVDSSLRIVEVTP